ncbi:hypothetical protein RRG08_033645 [Elysia crispata]|uniref:Uncharacterized protein n=1 Tax=Elysia crispata TaxID=231223 RepID=A0AAE0XRT1_9GAST|nr:hypothetical protein RRG08_033645 [Elysia crispata]
MTVLIASIVIALRKSGTSMLTTIQSNSLGAETVGVCRSSQGLDLKLCDLVQIFTKRCFDILLLTSRSLRRIEYSSYHIRVGGHENSSVGGADNQALIIPRRSSKGLELEDMRTVVSVEQITRH